MPFKITQSILSDFFYESRIKIESLKLGNYSRYLANILPMIIGARINIKIQGSEVGQICKINHLTCNDPIVNCSHPWTIIRKK